MTIAELVRRVLGRSRDHVDVTTEAERLEVRERQRRQEVLLRQKARLRGLDLQAETQAGWVPQRKRS